MAEIHGSNFTSEAKKHQTIDCVFSLQHRPHLLTWFHKFYIADCGSTRIIRYSKYVHSSFYTSPPRPSQYSSPIVPRIRNPKICQVLVQTAAPFCEIFAWVNSAFNLSVLIYSLSRQNWKRESRLPRGSNPYHPDLIYSAPIWAATLTFVHAA